ncbi:MAG TPA: hypothetical protein VE010_07805 [Thermoanaerobaculia bacterium]|nr:hypothetical protein [Thermoanaerobaculia bacterium]
MRRAIPFLLLFVFAGTSNAADHISAGLGLTHGGMGVEWLRTFEPSRTGVALGIGVLGVGGRVQYRFAPPASLSSTYVSAGALVMPWETNAYSDARAMGFIEGGWQVAARDGSSLYGDIGAGIGRTVGPRTRGNVYVPTFRLLVGWRFGGRSGA